MSEERFDRIDAALQMLGDQLTQTRQDVTGVQAQLRDVLTAQTDMRDEMTGVHAQLRDLRGEITGVQTQLRNEMTGVHAQLADMRDEMTGVHAQLADVRGEMTGMHAQLRRLDESQARMRNDMGVMHEEVLERIRIATDDTGLRMEMNRRFDEVLAELRDHAVPGDAADRYFARKINEHERRLRKLEGR